MSDTKATKEKIFAAAEHLLQDGYSLESITIRKIRTLNNNGGSLSTITKFLSQWKEQKLNQHNLNISIPVDLSDKLNASMEDIWFTAIKAARQHFEAQIVENSSLKEDLNLHQEETTALETKNKALTNELSEHLNRFVRIIDANKELFFTQTSKIEDAISSEDIGKIKATFDTYIKLQRDHLDLALDDQNKLLSNYINNLEINGKEVEPTTNTTTPASADLKESAQLVKNSINEVDKIN